MAKVAADLPRPTSIVRVDSNDLIGKSKPHVDPVTGLPKELCAFVVFKEPRMTVVPHFFSEAECDHLIQLVQGFWTPSLVGQATHSLEEAYGKGDLDNTLSAVRTSWSCMLRYAQTSVVERLEHRVARLSGRPIKNLERMNMVRYAPGEYFDEHHDGKFRPITIFVYLNELPEDEEAGDTFFPVLGMSFRPRRGTAVMWSNVIDNVEDSRMLHSGRAPTRTMKYGVNCFVNAQEMRHVAEPTRDIAPEEATAVRIGDLVAGDRRPEKKLVAYRLCADPNIVVVPGLLSAAEAGALLQLAAGEEAGAGALRPVTGGPYAAGTRTLRSLAFEETPLVQAVEQRLAASAGLGLKHLGTLRLVRTSATPGLCNRGCGPKSVYACLESTDMVLFTRLGMKVVLRQGDVLMWPNVDWETGQAVEDIRTLRVHLGSKDGYSGHPTVGLDAFFHDNPVREQQLHRKFRPDDIREMPSDVLSSGEIL